MSGETDKESFLFCWDFFSLLVMQDAGHMMTTLLVDAHTNGVVCIDHRLLSLDLSHA